MKKNYLARFSIMLSMAMAALISLAVMAPLDVHAAETIATVTKGSEAPRTYTSFDDLRDDLDDWSGESVVITMTRDWNNEAESGSFDGRLIIPKNSRVVLNMDGYVFDRALSGDNDWERNGELICMESGSTLTINGGSSQEAKNRRHDEGVHYSTNADDYATKPMSFFGGVLTGGSSTNGAGGIHVKSDCTLIMNEVTLAGCRAEVPWYDSAATNSGYGGGIWIAGGGSTVKLNDSLITGNHAQEDGGGIFGSNHNNMKLELNNSHVDKNYSRSDGGGIDLDGEYLEIKGTNGSAVSENETPGRGGGIYIWNDDVTVSGLNIKGNKAGEGGGVYTLEKNISLLDLEVSENSANTGGGIYVANEGTSITNCKITGNTKGYGVFVKGGIHKNFKLAGSTVIKDNPSEGGKDNLVIESFNGAHFVFALQRGADIGVRFSYDSYDQYCYLSEDKCPDYRQFLTSDNSNYYISYTNDSGSRPRYIAYVRKDITIPGGEPPVEKPEKKIIDPDNAGPSVVGKVEAGGEKSDSGDYALVRGYLHHEKTSSGTEDTDNIFYYSDGLFYGDPYTYNDHLATASWTLAFGGTYLREGGGKLESYKYKHTGPRQFYSDIGCPDQNIYVNDSNMTKPGTDSIGVIIGSKSLQKYGADGELEDTGDILIPIAVRGGGYESEWASNVLLGNGTTRDGEAQGFSEAADQVMSSVEYYISKYGLEDELAAGKVKFWVSGFSRAGATANITSKRLIEKYATGEDGKANQVFGYPCEAAKGGTDKAEKFDKTKYYCIHNLINAADIVPLVGPEEMGFKRYGVDHYIPGTAAGKITEETIEVSGAGEASGLTPVTTYSDNKRLNSKGDSSYDARRARMLKHLAAIDPSIAFDDYFHSKGLDILNLNFGGNAGAYEGSNMEDFIVDFLSFMQSSAIQSRDAWAVEKTTINGTVYGTVQQAARDTMALLFSIDEDSSASVMERLSKISEAMSVLTFSSNVSIRDLYDDVLGDWGTLSDADKMKYINYFWGLIDDSGALDFLPDGEAAKLEKNWPVLANMIFTFTDADWDTYPGNGEYTFPSGRQWAINTKDDYMMYACTLAAHLTTILNNHAPELNTAWARTYDSYYDEGNGPLAEASKEYIINWGSDGYGPDAPGAYIKTAGDDGTETETKLESSGKNTFKGDQKIYLENEEINGEAIFYDLVEIKDGNEKKVETETLYRGGIDLSTQDPETYKVEDKEYKIKAYSRHYGRNSDTVTYDIDLINDRHEVTAILGGDGQFKTLYSEGDSVSITAPDSKTGIFKAWKIEDTTDAGNKDDVTDKLLADGAEKNETLVFTMPEAETVAEGHTFARNYKLTVTAVYAGKVQKITVSGLAAPAADQPLDTEAKLSFDNGSEQPPAEVTLPVMWTYEVDEDTIADSGYAYGKTVYKAEIHVAKNAEDGRLFIPEGLTASCDSAASVDVTYNSTDGSAVITITFAETGDGTARPETLVPLRIQAYDVNGTDLKESTEYKVNSDSSVILTAPDMSNEVFARWDFGNTGISTDDDSAKTADITIPSLSTETESLTIRALYTPVVSKVAAEVAAPEAGKELPDSASMSVTITNEYEVNPDNIEVTWSPADAKAKNLTAYTGTVKLKPGDDGNIKVRLAGTEGEYTDYPAANITYSDALAVTLNDMQATYNTKDMSLSLAFDPIKYDLKAVKAVESMADLPHGSGADAISAKLPKTTKVVASDGTEMDAAINWGTPEKTSGGGDLDASTWKVDGTVTLPEGKFNDPDEETAKLLNVSVSVNVKEADTVSAPRASLDSGVYLGNQVITLSAPTAGSTIYYTLNGDAPTASSTEYKGEEIFFSRSDYPDGLTIRAIAVKGGMKTSAESFFEYKFTDEVDVPAGSTLPYTKNEQVGVPASSFYTLEAVSDGVTIDKEGNAVAKDVGTYEVKAKIADGMKWKIKDAEGTDSTTTEDQTITFSIQSSKFDSLAAILAKDSYDSLDQLKKDIKVVVKETGEEISGDAYEISYSNVTLGKVTVTVKGRGGFVGTITKTITITNINQMGVDGTPFGAGASLAAANKALTGRSSHADPKGTVYRTLKARSTKQGKKYVKLKWSKIKGASRYVVYGANCSSSYPYKMLGAAKGKSFKAKGLKKGTYNKFIVVAVDGNGNVVSTSKVVHAAPKGGKVGNYKKVKVRKKTIKKAKKLKVGRTLKIKAKQVKKGKKVKKHRKLSYESSNPSVATVSAKGKITAKAKGKCYIYVYAQNGVYKRIKVKVR